MSFHFCRIESLADEERLLREKLKIENQIRKHREKNRRSKTVETRKYSRIFEPVTNSLKDLKSLVTTTPLPPPPSPPPSNKLLHDLPRMDIDTKYLLDEAVDDTTLPPPMIPEVVEEEEEEEDEEAEGDLYLQALRSVPDYIRDDGVLGLNVRKGKIGSYYYSVRENVLTIDDGINTSFLINDINVWKLLLLQSPTRWMNLTNLRGKYISAVGKYVAIVEALDLVNIAIANKVNLKNRSKYKLLHNYILAQKEGSGFLFSVRPPPFIKKKRLFHPSTVVIPSDKKGLLRALLQAVAELRAGNTSMQNIVVPLAQEAKRKKILPRNLLSPDEMTWVFA